MSPPYFDEVSELLRALAAEVVMPRFQALAASEVHEKAPGDLVTIVDHEVEARLTDCLPKLIVGSRVVGEETVSRSPAVLGGVDRGWVWTVDPLDGTVNFVEGRPDFAMMVGLLYNGEPVGAWILAPTSGRLCTAEVGAGAEVNGERVSPHQGPQSSMKMAATRHLPPELRSEWEAHPRAALFQSGSGSAGVEYPALALGHWGSLFWWRTLPWDHVPGSLFIRETGGRAARLDGSRYNPADGGWGLLVTRSEESWVEARACLPI